jgi:hypothetical protein
LVLLLVVTQLGQLARRVETGVRLLPFYQGAKLPQLHGVEQPSPSFRPSKSCDWKVDESNPGEDFNLAVPRVGLAISYTFGSIGFSFPQSVLYSKRFGSLT